MRQPFTAAWIASWERCASARPELWIPRHRPTSSQREVQETRQQTQRTASRVFVTCIRHLLAKVPRYYHVCEQPATGLVGPLPRPCMCDVDVRSVDAVDSLDGCRDRPICQRSQCNNCDTALFDERPVADRSLDHEIAAMRGCWCAPRRAVLPGASKRLRSRPFQRGPPTKRVAHRRLGGGTLRA
jgi:hypothetical protein